MKRKRLVASAVLAGLFAIAAVYVAIGPNTSTPAQATTTTVNIGDNWFCDSSHMSTTCVTNVGVGDTVHWVWIGSNSHSSTSGPSSTEVWDSGIHGNGNTFDHTFNTSGSFSYLCSVHASMHGTIVVGGGGPTATPTFTRTPTVAATATPAGPTPTPTVVATATPGGATPTDTPIAGTPTAPSTATRTPTPTPTPAGLVGDANKDGHVDSIDAAIVLQYSAGLISSINPHADANQNGETNAIDATLILQYVAGLVSRLPP